MKTILIFLFTTTSSLLYAKAKVDLEAIRECRQKADTVLKTKLKACKLEAKENQRKCTMDALNKNSADINNCGVVQKSIPLN